MGAFLRNLGIVLIAVWLVLLLALMYLEKARVPWHGYLVSLGLVLVIGGTLISLMGRARHAVGVRRCARCSQRVRRGQVYCMEHFHEAVDRARDQQREDAS